MLKSHYSPVYPRMIPYDKLQCTGMYVHVREEYLSSTWGIRELYVVLRNGLHTGEEFLKCSKNKPYRPVQIILLSYNIERILYGKLMGRARELTWSIRNVIRILYWITTWIHVRNQYGAIRKCSMTSALHCNFQYLFQYFKFILFLNQLYHAQLQYHR